jgi:hypothetical protein
MFVLLFQKTKEALPVVKQWVGQRYDDDERASAFAVPISDRRDRASLALVGLAFISCDLIGPETARRIILPALHFNFLWFRHSIRNGFEPLLLSLSSLLLNGKGHLSSLGAAVNRVH